VAWKDVEGDMIVIASECEMQEAIANAAKGVLRLYTVGESAASTPSTPRLEDAPKTFKAAVTSVDSGTMPSQPETPRDPAQHTGVQCDTCDVSPIVGARYKCMVCDDFDLCAVCHDGKKHDEHAMVRIADANDHSWRSMFHHRRGPRWGNRGRCTRGDGPRGHHGGPPHSHSLDHLSQFMTNMNQHFTQHASATGENVNDYLKNVGQAVAEALGNIGIDVDVDVEDKEGKREKVTKEEGNKGEGNKGEGNKDEGNKGEESLIDMDASKTTTTTVTTNVVNETPVVDQPMPEVQVFDNGNWQFVNQTTDGDVQMEGNPLGAPLYPNITSAGLTTINPSAPPAPTRVQHMASSSTVVNAKLEAAKTMCLAHLLNMGFTNENGWLEAIVEAKHGDLNAVLSAMQRK
jgi:hypothetical protein